MKRIFLYIGALLALFSCDSTPSSSPAVKPDVIETQLRQMTLREKVGQLFCVRPDATTNR